MAWDGMWRTSDASRPAATAGVGVSFGGAQPPIAGQVPEFVGVGVGLARDGRGLGRAMRSDVVSAVSARHREQVP
jgi:hypothetical protein